MTPILPEAASGETKNTDQNFDLEAEDRQRGTHPSSNPPLPCHSLYVIHRGIGSLFPNSSASPYHPGPDHIRESIVGSYCHEPDLASSRPVLDNGDFGLDRNSPNTGAFDPS